MKMKYSCEIQSSSDNKSKKRSRSRSRVYESLVALQKSDLVSLTTERGLWRIEINQKSLRLIDEIES